MTIEANQPEHALNQLLARAHSALEVYSNVHRGMGHFSLASTALYERARSEVLHYFACDPRKYEAIFCSPGRLKQLQQELIPGSYQWLSSCGLGLSMGICALVVKKSALPKGQPRETGGGMVQLVNADFVVWQTGAERLEAGTPPILNAVFLGIALRMIRESGDENLFQQKQAVLSPQEIIFQDPFPAYYGRDYLDAIASSLVGRQVLVPTHRGMLPFVNFDNAASTPTFLPVWQTFCDALQIEPGSAQEALVNQAEMVIRDFFHAPQDSYDFSFACNTTEAINALARNWSAQQTTGQRRVIVNSILDHHSNELPWRMLADTRLLHMPVDREGFYDMGALEVLLEEHNQRNEHGDERISLVAVNGASNVLGSINALPPLSELCHRYGAQILVDGAQLSAHREVNLLESGVDYFVFSAHKAYSPFGSGGIFMRRGLLPISDEPCRGGLANAAGVAALAKALLLLQKIGFDVIAEHETMLCQHALETLRQIPETTIYGFIDTTDPRFANRGPIVPFEMKGLPHNLLAQLLAENGAFGTRTGCFCTHMLVIDLMRVAPWRSRLAKFVLDLGWKDVLTILPGLVRISFGLENSLAELERFRQIMTEIGVYKANPLNRWLASVHEGTWLLPRTKTSRAIKAFVAERVLMVFPPRG